VKHIFAIGHNDLRIFFRSRTSYLWLFVIPLGFVVGMSFAVPKQGEPANRRPWVAIENLDTGFLGGVLIEEMRAQGLRTPDPVKDRGVKPGRGVRVPADFTARVLAREEVNVEFFTLEGSNAADAELARVRLLRGLVAFNAHLLEAAAVPGTAGRPTPETMAAVRAKPDPVTLEASFAGRQPSPSGLGFSLPGNLVNFLMMNLLIFGGATVAAGRRNGTLRRLQTLPLRRSELVAGQLYGLVLLGAVQIAFFLLVGRFVFQLNLGANLPAVALVLLVFAWLAAALGQLIGSLLDAPDRIAGVSVLASLLMAALGGCWWPLEVAAPVWKTVAYCVPAGWALDALHQLISFGRGLDAVVTPLLVLVGTAVAATAAAAKFFRE
jgi:ABC-type multidrug transport system permease subunit